MENTSSEAAIPSVNLPVYWSSFDQGIVVATKVLVAFVGAGFTILVCAEVASRFLFDSSIAQANAMARLLLVWFFMLGAGLAFRQGAHIGLTTLSQRLSPRGAEILRIFAQVLILTFLLEMLWGSYLALFASLKQVEGTLRISMAWVMGAYPIGFGLLIYHQGVLLVDHARSEGDAT